MKLYLLIIAFTLTCNSIFCQHSFRLKPISFKGDTIEFLLPPHSKVAAEGIFSCRKKLRFKENSRFRYQYIFFQGLKIIDPANVEETLSGNYRFSVEKISKSIHFQDKAQASPILRQENYNLGYGNPVPIDDFCSYYSNGVDNLMLEIDLDAILKENTIWSDNYKKLNIDLFIALDLLSSDKNWPRGIAQYLVKKIYDFLPIPQDRSLDRYMAMLNADDKLSFVLLNPKIWVAPDTIQRRITLVDSLGNIKNVFPYLNVRPTPAPEDSTIWFYQYCGQKVIHSWPNKNGKILQSEVHNFSLETPLNNNYFTTDNTTILLSSSADIQLSEVLKKSVYYAFFQNSFKPNNELDNSFGSAPEKKDDLFFENSDLLFFDFFNKATVAALATKQPELYETAEIHAGVFGLRNSINLIIPVYVNKETIPRELDFNSTIYDIQQNARIPSFKIATLKRPFHNKWQKVKHANSETVLLPEDKIEFKF